ncbi:AAA family ATPase [Rhodovulum sulfidophilum]|uniref:AAA family ATPase n=1 Tax=Rhodovulum sulfidophilum TaxID=35806 RepID=UPI001F1B3017|nr:SMC family ATPase [Rhodovulum sulfidophilum]MCE8439658.1 SMC family ATPase [Rhodovulum sulfidophilum]
MRPVRLTLQAFGPFPGREVVDFRAAVTAGLFGIYGRTGSGKSTIFSAMTFALFGEAARAEQDAPSLRADHADPDMPTEVEFVFDLGARRYVLLRRPDQSRPKTRGSGETRDPHEAYLFDATGLPLDRIGAEGRGKILAEKKVGAVSAAVTELLGYGSHQFRQIVLLPQGRFETFLAARTRERLEILRELFDVSIYRRLAATMKTEAEMLERTLREARAVCEGRLAAEGFEGMEALETGLAAAEARLAEARTAEAAATREAAAARAELSAAEQTEARFLAAAAADQALAGIREAGPAMAELAAQVRRADRARLLLDLEARVVEAAREAEAASGRMDAAEARLETAKTAATRAAARQEAETARGPETEALRREVETLKRHAQTLAAAAELRQRAEEAQAGAEAARAEHSAAQGALALRMAQRGKAAEAVQAARQTSANRALLSARLQALETEMKAALSVEAATRDVSETNEAVARLVRAQEHAARRSSAAHAEMEAAERRLARSQALHLAAGLQPGAPCPVCGATDHPAPAAGAGEASASEAALRTARAAWEEADRAQREADRALASERGVLAGRQERLAGLDRPATDTATLKTRIQATHEALAALGAETEIAVAEGLLARLDAAVRAAEDTRERCREVIAEREAEALREAARIEAMLAPVPEALRSETALTAALSARQAALEARDAARQGAMKTATDAREAALAARAGHEAAVRAMAEARARHEGARQAFARRLGETGLSADDLAALKPAIVRLEEDRAAVEAHGRALAVAEERARATAEAVEGRTRPDLPALRDVLAAAETRHAEATERRAAAAHASDHLASLRDDLAGTLQRLEAEEAASAPLRRLSALFDGRNPQGLDLETYAIGAMFDRVLAAANRRLGPMSGGRYRLEREAEGGGGRGRRGLGLQVFDLFTGKARPTATLSGGETFIAALALALGLADAVESASGKVRLDTIFIDEGFGSLDTEDGAGTLDRVLQALGALVGHARAVGLISHVPLVQEAIPNGFYVHKEPAGSRIETRGPV